MRRSGFLQGVFACFFVVVALPGCDRETRPRCETCGMLTDTAPSWNVAVADSPGRQFDTPKCALRSSASPERLLFTEYYSGEKRGGSVLRFVLGSDVLGPMGRDFVPVDPQFADRFVEEHGGESLSFEEAIARLLDIP